jgi:hypothetical protein
VGHTGDYYMGCLAEVLASEVGVSVEISKETQKYLIEFILTYSAYDLKSLAELLDVNTLLLSQVVSGFSYLEDSVGQRLISWFFLFIGEKG